MFDVYSIKKKNYDKISSDLLIEIMTFIPKKFTILFRSVCKSWYNTFKSSKASKIIGSYLPFTASYIKCFHSPYSSSNISKFQDNILISESCFGTNLYTYNVISNKFSEKKSVEVKRISCVNSNSRYICITDTSSIYLLNSNFCLLNKWSSSSDFFNSFIDEDYIYCVHLNKITIFNFQGNIIKSIKHNFTIFLSNVIIHDKKIFTIDPNYNILYIYSLDGILLKKWNFNIINNYKISILRMAIYDDNIYLHDTLINKIVVFTSSGEILFEITYDVIVNFCSNFIVLHDYIFIFNSYPFTVHQFKLRYI